MDALYIDFPVSGVHTWIFLPPLVAFAVSFFSSMGGVSGAFFLLPYQVSVLHFVSPSVTSTNFLYNVVAIPSGVWRYMREGRMIWPLAGVIVAGTLPGIFLGYYLRVIFLPDPRAFRLFVGCVLLYIGLNLAREIIRNRGRNRKGPAVSGRTGSHGNPGGNPAAPAVKKEAAIRNLSFTIRKLEYDFGGEKFSADTIGLFCLAFVVGIVGGAYGIGGGAIIAPFCVAVFGLPVYTVAGAALLGTFLTSTAGVLFYSVIPLKSGLSTSPDWFLGILFGIGGMLGMYCGARLQRFVPQIFIKMMLAVVMLGLAARYILEYFG